MGPQGVIRERSCRRAVDSCPMSGSDSRTFLELGPGLCKGLQWAGMIHLGCHKSKCHEQMLVTTMYLVLDEEPGNIQANHLKLCCCIFKVAQVTTIFIGYFPAKAIYYTTLCGCNACYWRFEILSMQVAHTVSYPSVTYTESKWRALSCLSRPLCFQACLRCMHSWLSLLQLDNYFQYWMHNHLTA